MSPQLPNLPLEFYVASSPVLILSLLSVISLMQACFPKVGSPTAVFAVSAVGFLCALVGCLAYSGDTTFLGGAYLANDLTRFGHAFILVLAIVTLLFYRETFLNDRFFRAEIASLFAMVVTGMLVMVATEDLVTLFVGLELSSIGLYALVGYINPSQRSQEGAIKYFVLGALAAAFLLFGFGLIYAATGSLNLPEIMAAMPRVSDHPWIKLGVMFTVVGLGFKLALAPFHLWAPDAYEAAPTGLTAFMATSVKVMILIVTVRLFAGSFSHVAEVWMPAMMFLAFVSMILGNIMALVQNSMKRMLAYSSIAHSGYMAIAVCALSAVGSLPTASILFYLVAYCLVSIGAFGILMWLENSSNDNLTIDDITGLAKRHPKAAFAMAAFMFSFAGMPPMAGFIGKFFVFNAALKSELYSLVVIGIVGSAISLYYYLRVIVRMYMTEPDALNLMSKPKTSLVMSSILVATLVISILLGTVLPGPVMDRVVRTSINAH